MMNSATWFLLWTVVCVALVDDFTAGKACSNFSQSVVCFEASIEGLSLLLVLVSTKFLDPFLSISHHHLVLADGNWCFIPKCSFLGTTTDLSVAHQTYALCLFCCNWFPGLC